ncbi:MAG: hypothetical protein NTY41_09250, partial [Proteobacteria bacterium]|nr:hypothetical protein [Pseudomonadota bacterium]
GPKNCLAYGIWKRTALSNAPTETWSEVLMDWVRKHLLDLAELCQDCEKDPTLSMFQRRIFAETYLLTTRYSSLPNAGGPHNVASAITKLCGACQGVIQQGCAGRSDWKQACSLLRDRVHRQSPNR